MQDGVIAIPSMSPGGLGALRSGHFGRCDAFTLVEVVTGQVSEARVVANVDHTEGGCLVPVQLLRREGATAIVVAGIGTRPLMGFQNAGITVMVGPGERVHDVIEAFLTGGVRPIGDSDVCSAHHHS